MTIFSMLLAGAQVGIFLAGLVFIVAPLLQFARSLPTGIYDAFVYFGGTLSYVDELLPVAPLIEIMQFLGAMVVLFVVARLTLYSLALMRGNNSPTK